MHVFEVPERRAGNRSGAEHSPQIVLGITSAQTCVVLTGRLRALREAGFHVTLVAGPGELLDRIGRTENVETIAVPMKREIAPLNDLITLARLWRMLRKTRPDIVEFSTPKAGLLGMVAALLAGVPCRVYLLRGLKLETATGIKRGILRVAERLTAACARTVLCTSASLRRQAISMDLAPPAKLELLGAGSSVGVDVKRFSPGWSDVRKEQGLPESAAVLGFVGRLTRDKGLPELLDAFELILRSHKNTYLLLVGWFDEAEDALDREWRARIHNHPRIVCTGFVADAAPYYRAMDMLVLPTQREGFPNAVLEASATGIAVITTLSTGARDAVLPEVTGLLVPAGYPGAIAEAAERLLEDPDLRRRMGAAGRRWVMEQFSNRKVLKLNVEFYKNLLKRKTSKPLAQAAMELAARSR